MSECLEAALAYAERGWFVFPAPQGEKRSHKSAKNSDGAKWGMTKDPEQIRRDWEKWPNANVGIPTGAVNGFFVIEADTPKGHGIDGLASIAKLEEEHGRLADTLVAQSPSGSVHRYFRHPGRKVWTRAGMVPGVDVRGDGGMVIAPPSVRKDGTYVWLNDLPIADAPEWLLDIVTGDDRQLEEATRLVAFIPADIGEDEWSQVSSALHNIGVDFETFHDWCEGGGERYTGREDCLAKWNRPTQRDCGMGTLVHLAHKYKPMPAEIAEPEWPAVDKHSPIYQGLLGEIVWLTQPDTEADPIAILSQLLVCVGSVVGRNVYFEVEGDRHHANEFIVEVGDTSQGRKGTSMGQVMRIMRHVDEVWAERCKKSGLSSGEGVVYFLRDKVEKKDDKTGEMQVVDPGCIDPQKRLLAFEPELSQVLNVAQRQGNTVNTTLRMLWDGVTLSNLTSGRKDKPLTASDPHGSIIGHVTVEELRRTLQRVDAVNGFANRFLFFLVKRQRVLPRGGKFPAEAYEALGNRLATNVLGQLPFDGQAECVMTDAAWAIWDEEYRKLTEGRRGMVGAILGRAAPHVRRLAMIYAIADGQFTKNGDRCVVDVPQLRAAIALVRYAEASAVCIFGNMLGDQVADSVIDALSRRGCMTRTEIRELLGHHISAGDIARVRGELLRAGIIRVDEVRGTGGRGSERWLYARAVNS